MKRFAIIFAAALSFGNTANIAAAQEAARNPTPLKLASGGPDHLGWVSQAGERQGNKLRFWSLRMPQEHTRLRGENASGGTTFYSYDVMAILYEGDCGARRQLRRLRMEFYLGGSIHPNAPAPESLAASDMVVLPASDGGIALTVLCDGMATATNAPNMAEARRVTDEYFRKKASEGK